MMRKTDFEKMLRSTLIELLVVIAIIAVVSSCQVRLATAISWKYARCGHDGGDGLQRLPVTLDKIGSP